jgi:hypothetical protein
MVILSDFRVVLISITAHATGLLALIVGGLNLRVLHVAIDGIFDLSIGVCHLSSVVEHHLFDGVTILCRSETSKGEKAEGQGEKFFNAYAEHVYSSLKFLAIC